MNFKSLLPLLLGVILAGCDRGTAPVCATGDSACAVDQSVSPVGAGGSKPPPDTSSQPNPTASDWNPVYDTGKAITLVPRASLGGVPNILGGTARQLVFYVQDSTLHLIASSDGASFTNSGRETVYDLKIVATDSMAIDFDSKTDLGLFPNWASTRDLYTAFSSHPFYQATMKLTVTAWALNAHIRTRRGATLTIWAKARSGNPLGMAEDSLPRLDIVSTRSLLRAGSTLAPIASDPFYLVIP